MTVARMPLHADEIRWEAQGMTSHTLAPTPGDGRDQHTDTSWAQRFAAAHAETLRFDHLLGRWLVYRAPLWRPDGDGEIVRLAIAFVRAEQARALTLTGEPRKRAVKDALDRESKTALDRMLAIAKNLRPLADTGEGWDADPWTVGSETGLIRLKTGTLDTGDPTERVTLSVGAPYVADATCPRWIRFLHEIFDDDPDLIGFVHRYCGYALTGLTTEQVLLLLYGMGANGKTTFLNVLRFVFGAYATNLPFSALEQRGRSAIPNDIASLAGRRLATASETSEGSRLNEARLKALTGSDVISARFLFHEKFDFQPTAHFLLAANHKPLVTDSSYGFWRRLLLVPFTRAFTGAARDPDLEQRLRDEAPGILQWALTGCLAWQQDGLNAPESVRVATDQYREDSDPIVDFLAEACDLDAEASTAAHAIQKAYATWADRRGLGKGERLTKQALGQQLADRFPTKHTNAGRVYAGLRVATDRMF